MIAAACTTSHSGSTFSSTLIDPCHGPKPRTQGAYPRSTTGSEWIPLVRSLGLSLMRGIGQVVEAQRSSLRGEIEMKTPHADYNSYLVSSKFVCCVHLYVMGVVYHPW